MTRLAILAMMTWMMAACGDEVGNDGGLVGGSCASSGDCEYRCELGGDYPDGTCTIACDVDDDCPGGTYCIDTDRGGVCLLGCDLPSDCRPGYNCEGRRNRGHGGDSLVCSN